VKKPTDIGMNRTGIQASPVDSKKTIEGAKQSKLVDPGDSTLLAENAEKVRIEPFRQLRRKLKGHHA